MYLILFLLLSFFAPIPKTELLGKVELAAAGNEVLFTNISNQRIPNESLFNLTTDNKLKPFDRLEIKTHILSGDEKDKELLLYVSKEMLLGLSALPIAEQEFRDITIFYEKGYYYAVRDCFFDVYKWVDGNWKNLYVYDNKGYNCGTRFFFRQGKLYSIGGRGFWEAHSNLLVFDDQLGSWDRMSIKGQPSGVSSEYTGVTDKSFFYLFPVDYFGKRSDMIYSLDFNTNTWRKFDFTSQITHQKSPQAPFNGSISNKSLFDSRDYLVFQVYETSTNGSGLFVLDMNTFSFRWLKNQAVESNWKNYKWRIIHNNKVFLRNFEQELRSIDLSEMFNEAMPLGKPEELPLTGEEKLIHSIWRWSILAFFLGIGVNQLALYFRHKNDLRFSASPKK